MEETSATVVLDCGTENTKAGFAGDKHPRIFPSKIGYKDVENNDRSWIGGVDVENNPDYNTINPVNRDGIQDWDAMTQYFNYIFYNRLEVNPDEHPVLLVEPILNSKSNRERITKMMFEYFDVPAMFLSTNAVLSLYATGKTSGVAVDSGVDVTQVMPVTEGYPQHHAVMSLNYGGNQLTQYMLKLIKNRDIAMAQDEDRAIGLAKELKEKLCQVRKDPQTQETESPEKKTFELPDGQTLDISEERFSCPEAIFNPDQHLNLDCLGLSEAIFHAINKCQPEEKKDMFEGIVLGGGNTMFEGISDRVNFDVSNRAPFNMKVQTTALKYRENLAWSGGSMMGQLSAFQSIVVSKGEYDENGPTMVLRKCF
eukprot:gb/GECH01000404.1/.p1 GENE.gb/GECH01000404.1/~~gb/GECH01000404.1/.p1  ORF type:complete len:368 (+),score=100.49 gb/GECH01000404.1/:1-1104(+)